MTLWKKIDSRWIWIGLAVLAVLIRIVLSYYPEIVETYYSRGVFLGIRKIFDAVTFISPIPLIYVFFGIVLFIIVRWSVRLYRQEANWKQKLLQALFSTTAFLSALVFLFLILWGYNYQRIMVEDYLELDVQPLSLTELKAELYQTTDSLIQYRNAIPNATDEALDESFFPENFETYINQAVKTTLNQLNYPASGKANARLLKPKGILLVISTAGVYFPFVGEPNIDLGLHPISQPYILAHEFAHAYGFGQEGTCNFWAYLTCTQSDDPFVKYAGTLSYWRSLAVNYKRYEPQIYSEFRANLPLGIQSDLDAINQAILAYPDLFPRLRYATYNTFLKAQGIPEGIKSYDRVIMLGAAWRKKKEQK